MDDFLETIDFHGPLTQLFFAVRQSSRLNHLPSCAETLLQETVAALRAQGGMLLLPAQTTGSGEICTRLSTAPAIREAELESAARRYLTADLNWDGVCSGDLGGAPPGHNLWVAVECAEAGRGVLGLVRPQGPAFTESEQMIAQVIADQLAAVANHSRTRRALENERRELDRASFHLLALRHAAHMLGANVSLQQVIAMSLDMLIELMQVETGSIILYEKPSLRFLLSRAENPPPAGDKEKCRFVEADPAAMQWFLQHDEPLTRTQVSENASPLLERVITPLLTAGLPEAEIWAPLVANQVLLGYIALARKRSNDPFSCHDIQLLSTLAAQVATAIENSEKSYARELFRRYVSAEVVEEILNKSEGFALGGKRRRVTVLFADIRNFTSYAEQHDPAGVMAHLNEYFEKMGATCLELGGTLVAYIGDGLMALFGAPIAHEDDARRAVAAARQMQCQMRFLQEKWRSEGKYPFRIGIGVHTGEAIIGDVGYEKKMEYTAIGDTVNVASRLEGLTKVYSAPIIVSRDTLQEAGEVDGARLLGSVNILGKSEPVTIYSV